MRPRPGVLLVGGHSGTVREEVSWIYPCLFHQEKLRYLSRQPHETEISSEMEF